MMALVVGAMAGALTWCVLWAVGSLWSWGPPFGGEVNNQELIDLWKKVYGR